MRAVCPSGIPSLLAVLALGWVAPSSPPASAQPSAGALASDPLGDDWEENGIPFTDGAGGTRYYELPGADPDQKNLYVELDAMQGLTFPQASADAVVAAFAAAPLAPGGVGSIALVIDVDDADLPFETVTPSPADAFPANAASLKNTWFGTATERADPDAAALLAAKAKAFRYALLMNQSSPAIGGRAELPGDDMVLFAGGYDDIDKAAVFMHELGHNLNLGHGGSDGMNGKTNYPSIMNYLLAYREPRNATFWKLDYSREALALLDESAMNETVGIGVGVRTGRPHRRLRLPASHDPHRLQRRLRPDGCQRRGRRQLPALGGSARERRAVAEREPLRIQRLAEREAGADERRRCVRGRAGARRAHGRPARLDAGELPAAADHDLRGRLRFGERRRVERDRALNRFDSDRGRPRPCQRSNNASVRDGTEVISSTAAARRSSQGRTACVTSKIDKSSDSNASPPNRARGR